MSEKPVSPVKGEPLKVENYYFQIVLVKLISKRAVMEPFSNLRFTIVKGKQKFESTKNISPVFVDGALTLTNHRLNFVAINYNSAKLQEFTLKVLDVFQQNEKELGEYIVDCNSYVDHYRQTENGAFVNQWDLGQLFSLDIEIYIDRSRYGVERLHREVKNPKPKRPDEQSVVVALQNIVPKRRERIIQDSLLQKSMEKENRYRRVSPKKDVRLQISKRYEAPSPAKKTLIEQPPVVKEKQVLQVKKLPETPKKVQVAKESLIVTPSIVKSAQNITQTPVSPLLKPPNPIIEPQNPRIEPVIPQVKPTIPQVQAVIPQVQLPKPQVQSAKPQVQSAKPQVQSAKPQVQSAKLQVQPAIIQIEEPIPQIEAPNLPKEQIKQANTQNQSTDPQIEPLMIQKQPVKPQQEIVISQPEILIPQTEPVNPQAEPANPPTEVATIQIEPKNTTEVQKPIEIETYPQIKEACQVKLQPQTAKVAEVVEVVEVVEVKKEQAIEVRQAIQKKNTEQFFTPKDVSIIASNHEENIAKDQGNIIKNDPVIEEIKQVSVKNSRVLEVQADIPVEQVKITEVPEQSKQLSEQTKQVPEQNKPPIQIAQVRPRFKLSLPQLPAFITNFSVNIKIIGVIGIIVLFIGVFYAIFSAPSQEVVQPISIDPTLITPNQTDSQILPKKIAKKSKKANKIKEPEATPSVKSDEVTPTIEILPKQQVVPAETVIKTKKKAKQSQPIIQNPKKLPQKKRQSPPPKPAKPTLKATKTIQPASADTVIYKSTVIPPRGNKAKKTSTDQVKPIPQAIPEPPIEKEAKRQVPKAPPKVKEPKKAKSVPTPSIKPVNTKFSTPDPPAVQTVAAPSVNSIASSNTAVNSQKPPSATSTPIKKKCRPRAQ